MSELKSKIKSAMTDSMRARTADRTQSIRMVLAAIQRKEIELNVEPLDNSNVEKVLFTMVKQLQETIEQAKGAGRAEMAAAAEVEVLIIKEFLPQLLSEAEVGQLVSEIITQLKADNALPTGGAAMGAVMKQVIAKVGSKAEGKVVQAAVKKALGT